MSHYIKIGYYDKFHCTADQCPFTCCQEWRIGVDEKTLHKWKDLKLKAIESREDKQSQLTLCECVEKEETGHIISLGKDKKCPFLNKKKLCRIVLELGDAFLSETCTTFPRQINTFEDRTEYSLDPGCPAVVDLLNENLQAIQFLREGSEKQTPSLLYAVREMILTMIENQTYSLPERMMIIFYSLLELLEKNQLTEDTIKAYTNDKQLQSVATAIRKMRFNAVDSLIESNELFLDVVENYRKQKLYVKYLEPIAKTAEQLETLYDDRAILEKMGIFEKQVLAYETLIKNYLVAEIFGNCLSADMTLEDVVMGFEWVTLEYAILKQALFLKWLTEGEETLSYSMVRDYITVVSRVTGYETSDIKEYLENSFESIIWEWGYLALVVGNRKI